MPQNALLTSHVIRFPEGSLYFRDLKRLHLGSSNASVLGNVCFVELTQNYLVTYSKIRFIFVSKATERMGTISFLGRQQPSLDLV